MICPHCGKETSIKSIFTKEDFEKLYAVYPRKDGKKAGITRCLSSIKSQIRYDEFKQALENYCSEIKKNKTEKKYIKQFSTFVNNWEDYLETEESMLEKKAIEADNKVQEYINSL